MEDFDGYGYTWAQTLGYIDSFGYDERQYVSEHIRNKYNTATRGYEKYKKFVYFLNEEGRFNEEMVYLFSDRI